MITEFKEENAFLSNFFESPFVWNRVYFPTVEHFFQAMKCECARDFRQVVCAKTPGDAKRIGRRVSLRPEWEEIKVAVMRCGLRQKFGGYEDLRRKLLATTGQKLIEGNTWGDTFWGAVWDGKTWVGENKLGELLVELRRDYGAEEG